MIAILSASFVIVVLVAALVICAIFSLLYLLSGEGKWAAIWFSGAAVSAVLVFFTFGEIFT